jgi:starch-binding outer membrane protein, SusD/RagB family
MIINDQNFQKMKRSKNIISLFLVSLMLVFSFGCETEFTNPNAPTDAQILNSREGLFALGVGIRQLYSTAGIRFMVENNAVTTREAAITTTFINMVELEEGGDALTDFNTNVEGLWATMLRVMSMSEDLIRGAERVELTETTKANLIAYGSWFKAMAIGALAQNYSQVVIQTNRNNEAQFVSREQAYQEAIRLLELARTNLSGDLSNEFSSILLRGNIDIRNSVNTYLARYNLFAGNFDAAILAANAVNTTSTSVFSYDQLNQNPIWARVFLNNAPNFKPRDNFGLPDSFNVDPEDGRFGFYLVPSPDTNINGLPIERLLGFFTTDTRPIPVYLPGEIPLIIAEANLRKASPDINAAISAINEVRTKTNDPFELNAGLTPYSGPITVAALLDEVYVNRRLELFFTGVSLVDSRRFNRPEPTGSRQFQEERNRNFYPFPLRERNNNANTPANPPI